ncbi:MAG: hypothetical protein IT381_28265 [Deltaproteobacteria bacterium]|nr:hypothetical protein [Deltaproteobacteria bacterium]
MAIKAAQRQQEPPAPEQFPHEREIDGVRYASRYMDPERLIRHVGKVPGLLQAMRSGTFGFDEGLMTVVKDCFDLAAADGRELRNGFWKVHFLGRPGALASVMLWLAEVHFVPFLAGGKQALDVAMGSLGAQLVSPAEAAAE